MSKSYDITDWDRLEYVQLAHEECGAALQHVIDAEQQVLDGPAARALAVAQQALTSLLERLALRVSDLIAEDEEEAEVEQTWTFFGHWDDSDSLVWDAVILGEHQDERQDDGTWAGGLFADSASGKTQAEAEAKIREEYENHEKED